MRSINGGATKTSLKIKGIASIKMYASQGEAGGRLGIAKASAMLVTREGQQSTSLRTNENGLWLMPLPDSSRP